MKNLIIKITLLFITVTMLIIAVLGNGVVKAREINDLTETEEKQWSFQLLVVSDIGIVILLD